MAPPRAKSLLPEPKKAMPERIVLDWDGGHAASLALRNLELEGAYETEALLLQLEPGGARHRATGLRRELLEAQAELLGKQLHPVELPADCSQGQWEEILAPELLPYVRRLVRPVAFTAADGLDWRRAVEHFLISFGMRGVFPMWRKDPLELARLHQVLGLRSIVVAVDTRHLPEEHLGRPWDPEFVASLPAGVHAMGHDTGQGTPFSTLAVDGPHFPGPLETRETGVLERGAHGRLLDLAPA
jgi:diphthamide synthase (EF-2-diphthine--ammonia ligase)